VKAEQYCLETGQQAAYPSDAISNEELSIRHTGDTRHFEKLGKAVLSGNKKPLQSSLEFIAVIAFIGDALIIFGSMTLGVWLGYYSGLNFFSFASEVTRNTPWWVDQWLSIPGTLFLLVLYAALRLYRRNCFTNFSAAAKIILIANAMWMLVRLAFSSVFGLHPLVVSIVISFVCVTITMMAWRLVLQKVLSWKDLSLDLDLDLHKKVVFVGWGREAERLEEQMRRSRNQTYQVVGYFPSSQEASIQQPPTRVPLLGEYSELVEFLRKRQANVVMLADLNLSVGEITNLANLCEMQFTQFKVIPSYFSVLASCVQLESINGVPVLGVSALPLDHLSHRVIKRAIDIFGALVGLFLSFPIMAIFAAIVYWESPGSVLYRQVRTGKNGKPFKIIKIRSMRLDAEKDGKAQWCKEGDPRRLKIGALMRKLNVDELPQFWNVLKGEMSLVGPRPERPELIKNFEKTIPHYHVRHNCLPGITGWAQVNGWRGDTSLEQRVLYDIWYVENWSLALDFRIMILTLGDSALVRQSGAY
jgi:exopolysaccharide biosynthesis polyprenyl glycosylphosphotransferase